MAVFIPGISPYAYADDNPINKIDYMGLFASDPDTQKRPKKPSERRNRKRRNKESRRGKRTAAIKPKGRTKYNPNFATIVINGTGLRKPHPMEDVVLDPLDFGTFTDNTQPKPYDDDSNHSPKPTREPIIESPSKGKIYAVPFSRKSVKINKDLIEDNSGINKLVEELLKDPLLVIKIAGNIGVSGNVTLGHNDLIRMLEGEMPVRRAMRLRASNVYYYLLDMGVNMNQMSINYLGGDILQGRNGVSVTIQSE